MAFIGRLGTIPIYGGGFLIGNPGNALFSSNRYGFNWVAPNMFGDTDEEIFNTFKNYAAQLPGTAGSTVIKFPLHKDATLTDSEINTDFEIVVNAEGQAYSSTVTIPNLITGVGSIPWNNVAFPPGWGDGRHTYILGIPVYSDAMQTTLTGIVLASREINTNGNSVGSSVLDTISISYFKNRGFNVKIVNYDPDFGPGSEPDGYGQNGTPPAFNHTSDIIGLPPIPSVSTSSVGFIHLYNVTQYQLTALSDYLFPDIMQDLADIIAQLPVALNDLPNVLVPVLRAFASIFAYRDSVQYIIDLHAIPCAPSVGGSNYIKVGALSTDITAGVISSDYVEVDCGSLSIPEQFKNFLDYMVSCKIFIPFVGFVDIKPELWNGGTIGLKYRFNVIDGSFMAYLVATSGKSQLSNTVIGQYGGSACLHLPMVAAEYGAIIGGIVQGSLSNANAGAAASAGSASQLASAEAGLASALMQFDVNPKMSQSNGYNASSSFLGGRTPYLMIEYPVPQFSTRYTHEKGLPLNVTMAFKDLRGYTEIDESVDLSGIDAPVDVLDEIRSALASGTIF